MTTIRPSLFDDDETVEGHCSGAFGVDEDWVDVYFADGGIGEHELAEAMDDDGDGVDVEGWGAAEAFQGGGTFELVELVQDGFVGEVWWDEADVVEGLCEDAAEADEEDGAPIGVILCADDKFRGALAHGFHEDTV